MLTDIRTTENKIVSLEALSSFHIAPPSLHPFLQPILEI